jgi:hypothetical protein
VVHLPPLGKIEHVFEQRQFPVYRRRADLPHACVLIRLDLHRTDIVQADVAEKSLEMPKHLHIPFPRPLMVLGVRHVPLPKLCERHPNGFDENPPFAF